MIPPEFQIDTALVAGNGVLSRAEEKLAVRYSPAIARWIAEREEVSLLPDGSVVVEHPLLDDEWAVRYVLQYASEAELLKPQRLRVQFSTLS